MQAIIILIFLLFLLGFIIQNINFIISILAILIIISIIVFVVKKISKTEEDKEIYKEDKEEYFKSVSVSYYIDTSMSKKTVYYNPSDTAISSNSKQLHSIQNYQVIHKNDGFNNNMNLDLFEVKGILAETNRKKKKKFHGKDEEAVKEKALSEGFIEPLTITKIDFKSPADRQLEAMKNHGEEIPVDACSYDISALIAKSIKKDSVPNPDLLAYATSKDILLSYYIGKKALYNLIWETLQIRDKIAFFIFCIYRYKSNDRIANLEDSPHKSAIYTMAHSLLDDKSFIKSMNQYRGDSLRFFGELKVNKGTYTNTYQGGSTKTIAYKRVMEFLNGTLI